MRVSMPVCERAVKRGEIILSNSLCQEDFLIVMAQEANDGFSSMLLEAILVLAKICKRSGGVIKVVLAGQERAVAEQIENSKEFLTA